MRKSKKIILAFILILSYGALTVQAQEDSDYCEEQFRRFQLWDSQFGEFIIHYPVPEIIGGIKSLYENVHYPEEAIEAGLEGAVWIWFIVREDGTPVCGRVLQSVDPMLDTAALKAIESVEYKPARNGDKPTAMHMIIPFHFSLSQK